LRVSPTGPAVNVQVRCQRVGETRNLDAKDWLAHDRIRRSTGSRPSRVMIR
jgi:hypothetical protein